LHRARERVIKARTALVNEIRGLLGEYEVVLPQSVAKFRQTFLPTLEAEQAKFTALSRELFEQLYDEFCALEKRLAYYNERLEAIEEAHPVCQRLQTIPGVGPLTATALVAAVSEASHFKNGRQFAAWLGLVPGQHSTGGKAVCWGSANGGMVMCGSCSSMAPAPCSAGSGSRWIAGANGSEGSSNDGERTAPQWRWRIRTRGLPGCC
jgi:transposase